MNELNETQKEWLARYKSRLDNAFDVKARNIHYLLTKSEIRMFYTLGEKRFTHESLSNADRKAKSEAKISMQNAFVDIVQVMGVSVPLDSPDDEPGIYTEEEWKRELMPVEKSLCSSRDW